MSEPVIPQASELAIPHLELSDAENERLKHRIQDDFRGAIGDHEERITKFTRAIRMWRGLIDSPAAGEEAESNYQVPLMRWMLLTQLARLLQALLGDEAEIQAVPVGPSDQKSVHKVGRYLTWRFISAMEVVEPLAEFVIRMLALGRSIVYMPYESRGYEIPGEGEQTEYEGPCFKPCHPDSIIVPAKRDAKTIHDFPWMIHRQWFTPSDLVGEEEEGRMFGITENYTTILLRSRESGASSASPEGDVDAITGEEEVAQGVSLFGSESSSGTLEVQFWYGKWRLLKGKADAEEDDVKRRALRETDVLVKYIPDLELIVGFQRLDALYPKMPKRRPFEDAALLPDGTYWGPSYFEWLESEQNELSSNHNMSQKVAELAANAPVFYDPASGFKPDKFELEPGMAYPVAGNPANAVQTAKIAGDISGLVMMSQAVKGYGESVVGLSDQSMGRSIDRPNAPRTAAGQIALIEQGNIRGFLEILFLRESFKRILRRVWMLDSSFAPESVFFRVTEEEAKGLFDVANGGAEMTPEEFGGRYDFRVQFADSAWSREAKKQRQIELYSLDLQNPLIAMNPRALWLITQQLHKAMGDDNFADVMPEPPDLGMPKSPREEWTLMLQGEAVEPNPLDNDDLHLTLHYRQLDEAKRDKKPDEAAIAMLAEHIIATEIQKREKVALKAMADLAAQRMGPEIAAAAAMQEGGDPAMGGGQPAMAAPGMPAMGGGMNAQ